MTIYLPPNGSLQDYMIHTCIHEQDDLVDVSDLSLHEHAMYEHYASDYESVGLVYFRGPLQHDSHLIIDNRLRRYNIDRTTTVMNSGRIVNVSISP